MKNRLGTSISTTLALTLTLAAQTTRAFEPQNQNSDLFGAIQKVKSKTDRRSTEDWQAVLSVKNSKGETLKLRSNARGKNQPDPRISWATQDPQITGFEGTSTERAYAELRLQAPKKKITVAVIDSGVDVSHFEFKQKTYKNFWERFNILKRDGDQNGFTNDTHGWNFLGSSDGSDVTSSTSEVTRELGRMRRLKQEALHELTEAQKTYLQELEELYAQNSLEETLQLNRTQEEIRDYQLALEICHAAGLKDESLESLNAIQTDDPTTLAAIEVLTNYWEVGITLAELRATESVAKKPFEVLFNTEFDMSEVIGDNPLVLNETRYGNPHITTATADHGTHVAGIIAGRRNNQNNLNGQAEWVKILPVRILGDTGDERDKDVANAIRYAVDQGAKVINMSFGKPLSPDKAYVDEAIQYAADHDVLLIHAAGNESKNIDSAPSFPSPFKINKERFQNWIEVGASTSSQDTLAANFSNYGANTVDLFAPGSRIYSTIPTQGFQYMSGTSMAAPEVAGVAALVWSQAPHLSAVEIREVLKNTTRKYSGLRVKLPFFEQDPYFKDLSSSGGIIDAYQALLALGIQNKK